MSDPSSTTQESDYMPDQESATSHEQALSNDSAVEDFEAAKMTAPYEGEQQIEEDDWDESLEPPRRPRQRLIGTGGNPVAVTLLVILAIAIGFFAGVKVQKSQGSSAAVGGAGKFAALAGARAGAARRAGFGAAAGAPAGLGAAGGASTDFTTGEVTYKRGSTLYVTNSEGNTIKVLTNAGLTVNKTITSSVKAIYPGETLTVLGSKSANGSIKATSVTVGNGSSSATATGTSSTGTSSTGTSSTGSGSSPALFGPG